MKRILLALLLLSGLAQAQYRTFGALNTNNAWTANNSWTGVFDASGATFARPFRIITVAQLPTTCNANKDVVWIYDTATASICNTLGNGWVSLSGGNPGTVTSVSTGNALPLFTASFSSPTSTPSLSFTISNFSAHKFYGNNTGSTGLPAQVSIGTADLPFTYSGNTTKLGTIAGTTSSGKCLEWDAFGNIATAVSGLACGAGGGGGTPGGASTSIQYNNAGAFGGFGTWDGTTLTIPGSITSSAAVGSNGTLELGASSSTTQNWVWAHSADAASNAEPGYFKASASPADAYHSFLFPCSSSGNWCKSGTTPGADSANYLPSLSDLQSQTGTYYLDTGAADAYVILPSPAIGAYAAGQRFIFKAANANTLTNPTLKVSGLAVQTITKSGTAALAANDIKAGQVVTVIYDGTRFQMQSQVGNASGAGTPGGADTQVQFNDGGVFGGSANYTFNKTTGVLSLLGGSGSPSVVCGSGSATVPCGIEGDSGDAVSNAEAAYLKLGTSPANTRFNYFYPASAAGRFCFSGTVPAQDCVGTLADFAAQISDSQNQLGVYYADSGSSTAYVITPNPAIGAYATGQRFVFKATNANTITNPTLAVSGLAAKTIMRNGTQPLIVGDIAANQMVEVQYDGTQWEMTSQSGTNPGGTLDKQDVIAGINGNSADQTIYTYSMPSGTLASGKCLRVTFYEVRTVGAGNATMKIIFGATTVTSGVVGAATVGAVRATVCNNAGSTTAQWGSGEFQDGGAYLGTTSTPAENTNSGSAIVVKGTFNIASGSSFAGKGWTVELLP